MTLDHGSKNARILKRYAQAPGSTDADVAGAVGIGEEAVARRRQRLVDAGLLDEAGQVTGKGLDALKAMRSARSANDSVPRVGGRPARYQRRA